MIIAFDEAGVPTEITQDLLLELKFLRYFYNEASFYMGPADCDIYDSLKEHFMTKYGKLPKDYEFENNED